MPGVVERTLRYSDWAPNAADGEYALASGGRTCSTAVRRAGSAGVPISDPPPSPAMLAAAAPVAARANYGGRAWCGMPRVKDATRCLAPAAATRIPPGRGSASNAESRSHCAAPAARRSFRRAPSSASSAGRRWRRGRVQPARPRRRRSSECALPPSAVGAERLVNCSTDAHLGVRSLD